MALIYGHHGAKGEAPEDTLTSFQRCLRYGVNRCELDLYSPRDGGLIMIHNPTLKRTTGCCGKVAEHDAATLIIHDARGGGPSWAQPTPIPRLEKLFEKYPLGRWQLEAKSASRERTTWTVTQIRESTEHFGNRDKVTVTSGLRIVLKAFNELTPELSRGLVTEYTRLDPLKVAQHYGCALLALNWTLCAPECLLRAQCQGLRVSVWMANESALMRRLAGLGADSLITGFPGLASATLRNRRARLL